MLVGEHNKHGIGHSIEQWEIIYCGLFCPLSLLVDGYDIYNMLWWGYVPLLGCLVWKMLASFNAISDATRESYIKKCFTPFSVEVTRRGFAVYSLCSTDLIEVWVWYMIWLLFMNFKEADTPYWKAPIQKKELGVHPTKHNIIVDRTIGIWSSSIIAFR